MDTYGVADTAVSHVSRVEMQHRRQADWRTRRNRWVRIIIGWVMAAALAVMGYFLYFGPTTFGGPATYHTVSGISMTSTFHNGDLIIAEKQSHYGGGDIIVYRVPAGQPDAGLTVADRIVGGSDTTGLVTAGDRNHGTDHWHPKITDVLGKVWFSVPHFSRWLSGRVWMSLAVIAFGLVGLALLRRRRGRARRRVSDREPQASAPPEGSASAEEVALARRTLAEPEQDDSNLRQMEAAVPTEREAHVCAPKPEAVSWAVAEPDHLDAKVVPTVMPDDVRARSRDGSWLRRRSRLRKDRPM